MWDLSLEIFAVVLSSKNNVLSSFESETWLAHFTYLPHIFSLELLRTFYHLPLFEKIVLLILDGEHVQI